MHKTRFFLAGVGGFLLALWSPIQAAAQAPLGIRTARGQTVTPVFEGWYVNSDGSYSLSFGYFNRNFEEVLEIPAGQENHIEPREFDGVQPTRFHARRHWGVFTVNVPPDFGDGTVVWTLKNRGGTFSIPGSLKTDWQIDALEGEAGAGNTPPVLAFAESGPTGGGPGGVSGGPIETETGKKTPLTVWASDDGRSEGTVQGRGEAEPVTLNWFKHSGPGDVTFSEVEGEVPVEGGTMTTHATFSAPGEYVLRVRANDASGVSEAGHAQCCWSNGFLKVTVTK